MEDTITVSVIIPVYNTEKCLEKCLDSLVNQTLKNMEIICVDDISTDNSYEILLAYQKKYSALIKVIKLDEKLRQGGARNRGLNIARGKYIAFVDSDDYVDITRYEKLYFLAEEKQVDYVYCGYYEEYAEELIIRKPISHGKKPNERIVIHKENRNEFIANTVNIWSGMFHRKVFLNKDVYFPEKLAYEDNYTASILPYYIKSYAFIEDCSYYYNKRNSTATTAVMNSPHHLDRMVTAEKMLEWYEKRNDYEEIKEAVEYLYLELYYIHTVSILIYYYDKIDYKKIVDVRKHFLSRFPEYNKNKLYRQRFSKIKRMIFSINEISPRLYAIFYIAARKLKKVLGPIGGK